MEIKKLAIREKAVTELIFLSVNSVEYHRVVY